MDRRGHYVRERGPHNSSRKDPGRMRGQFEGTAHRRMAGERGNQGQTASYGLWACNSESGSSTTCFNWRVASAETRAAHLLEVMNPDARRYLRKWLSELPNIQLAVIAPTFFGPKPRMRLVCLRPIFLPPEQRVCSSLYRKEPSPPHPT